MINITDKTKCCGCSACFNICSKNAISMEYDSEGFLYPKVDNAKCIKCGLCLKVCPIINNKKQNKVLEVYGAKNKNTDEQLKSSSGGMFSIFANYVLENNGIVFGAAFDNNWNVVHKYIDKKEDLDYLRRSKYVQSDINRTYRQAKQFLENNRLVLFTGTPCQIAGLKRYLQKNYENLITIDFICFGVPSPKVWEKFLIENFDVRKLKSINFKCKDFAWDKFYLKIEENSSYKTFINNIKIKLVRLILKFIDNRFFVNYFFYLSFFKGFNYRLFLRPSCHICHFVGDRNSDFTIYDLWGIRELAPSLYDKKGVSGINVNSTEGLNFFLKVKNNLDYIKIDCDKIVKFNPRLLTPKGSHPNREEFFKRYHSENLNKLIPIILNEKPLIIKLFKKVIKKIVAK